MQVDKKYILDLIADFQLEKALETAKNLFTEDSTEEIIALSSRYVKVCGEYFVRYTVSDKEYNIEINRIISGLLFITKAAEIKDGLLVGSENDGLHVDVNSHFHPLHRFPRGPMVPPEKIPLDIIAIYAELIDHQKSAEIINEAVRMRKEADDDDKVTTIKLIDLPPHDSVPPIDYWRKAFMLSCLHGPRMLGAILLSLSDEQFPSKTKKTRRELIVYLESMWNL